MLSDPYKYGEYFYIKITDTTLTFKKSQQYKGLKIFQWLCSKKNHSQLKRISGYYAIFTIQNYRVFDNFERRTEVQESDCLKILGRAISKSNLKLSGDYFLLRIDNLTFLIARLRDSGG